MMIGHRRPSPTGRRRAISARWRANFSEETGTSLPEIMVGMTLMAVFLAMFTGAIVMMNTAMKKTQAVNASATQLNSAFLNLDRAVRYAAFISTPGISANSGDWYVEFRLTIAGADVCEQLRIDAQQLQSRTWANVEPATPGAWVPISSGITNGDAVAGAPRQPFLLVQTQDNITFQQLRVTMVSPAGSGSTATSSESTFTFTALNSRIPLPVSSICQQPGRP